MFLCMGWATVLKIIQEIPLFLRPAMLAGTGQVPEEEHVQRVRAQAAAAYVRCRGEALRGQGQHRVHRLRP